MIDCRTHESSHNLWAARKSRQPCFFCFDFVPAVANLMIQLVMLAQQLGFLFPVALLRGHILRRIEVPLRLQGLIAVVFQVAESL